MTTALMAYRLAGLIVHRDGEPIKSIMDRAGHELFARFGLTVDPNRGVGGSYFRDLSRHIRNASEEPTISSNIEERTSRPLALANRTPCSP